MVNQISDEKVELLLTLAEEGKSIREMAQIAKVSKQTAQNYQQAHNQYQKDAYGIDTKPLKGGYWKHKNTNNS